MITGNSGEHSFCYDDLKDEKSVFAIAYVENNSMGCGALRRLSDTEAEIKRVYSRANNKGVAHKIVKYLENTAIEMGYKKVHLETRKVNTHAVEFYKSCGYKECLPYGKYKDKNYAVCFSKNLI